MNELRKQLKSLLLYNNKAKKVLVFLLIVFIFLIIFDYGLNYTSGSKNLGLVKGETILMHENTVISIEPNQYVYIHFSVANGEWRIQGSLVSSTSAKVILLYQNGFYNFTRDVSFNNAIINICADSVALINATISSGNYYLVFYNHYNEWGIGIQFTSNLMISKC